MKHLLHASSTQHSQTTENTQITPIKQFHTQQPKNGHSFGYVDN